MCPVLVQATGRLNPFPFVDTPAGCFSLSRSGLLEIRSDHWNLLFLTMPPPRDDQYISISPTASITDSAGDDAGDGPTAAAPSGASHEECRQVGDGLINLPAASNMPAPKSVGFQQFCDGLRTDLPGDSYGRGSFDTSARFVAGDPGAKFGATAPLEYETTGDVGHGLYFQIDGGAYNRRRPTLAHIGGLPTVPNMAAAIGSHPSGAMDARALSMPVLAPPYACIMAGRWKPGTTSVA